MKRMDLAENDQADLIGGLAEKLRERGPLAALGADAVPGLIRLGALIELAPGEALIRENDAATPEIYLLVAGSLVVKAQGGMMARLHRPGDVVGEVAVLLSSKRTADVIADTAARVLALPARVLKMPEYAAVSAGVSGAMLRDDWVQY